MIPRFYTSTEECHIRSKMSYDEACLKVVNNLNTSITMMSTTTECYKCDMKQWQVVDALDEEYLTVYVTDTLQFGFVSDEGTSCNITHTFKQHGLYLWNADLNCQPVQVEILPDNPYVSIFVLFGICVALCIASTVWKIAKHYKITDSLTHKFGRSKDKDGIPASRASEASTTATTATSQTSQGKEEYPVPEVIASQVFRGLVILAMIVCNGDMGSFWFLQFSPWNGIMPFDFIYPWFLWSSGMVLYLKYRAELMLGSTRQAVLWEITLRSLRYVVLGFCLNTFEQNLMSSARIPGELQRWGVLHLVMFGIDVSLMKKEVEVDIVNKARDLLDCWVLGTVTLACLLVNLLITFFLPVPDCPTGYRGPGGSHLYSRYPNCTGGAARYIDSLVFGNNHLYQFPEFQEVYHTTQPFDPEGLLGTLNCLLTVFSGMQAARIFVYYSKVRLRFILLLTWGSLQTFLGLCLCGFTKEEGPIPLNKSLWSPSFALFTSGIAFLVFAALHMVVDVRQWWSGSPCFEAGLNTMLLYIGHQVLIYSFPFSWVPIKDTSYFEFSIMAVITVSFWIGISVVAYKHYKIVLI